MTGLRVAGLAAGALGAALVAVACFSEHEPSGPDTALTCARAVQPPGPDTVFVVIQGFAFQPANLTVAAGERVVWINCEGSGTPGHTTTATGGAWDSPTLQPGDVVQLRARRLASGTTTAGCIRSCRAASSCSSRRRGRGHAGRRMARRYRSGDVPRCRRKALVK